MLKFVFRHISNCLLGCLLGILTLVVSTIPASVSKAADAEAATAEYVLKAGFIYNFTQFIEWPEEAAFSKSNNRFFLCVAGEDPFGTILNQVAQKRRVKGRTLVIKRNVSGRAMRECHILFVSKSAAPRLAQILKQMDGLPTLIVGDTPGFAQRGTGINFVVRNNKIRFEINRRAIERTGLKISSELLNLGILVGGRK